MMIRSGSLGETVKLNALSSGSLSAAIRTVPRVLRAAGVNGANVTDAELFGSTDTCSVCTACPSISSVSSTFDAALPSGW